MIRHSSVFSQVLAIFSRFEFASLVRKYQNDKGAKRFSSWDQCVSMLFCQLALPLMDFPEGSVVAMDRGYNDYRIFALWTEKGVWFVTRMKDNVVYHVVE